MLILGTLLSPISFASSAFVIQLECDKYIPEGTLSALTAANRKLPGEQMRPIRWAQLRQAKTRTRAVTAIAGLHSDSPWLALNCGSPSTDNSEAPLQTRSTANRAY
jgi:hypothetical protein